MRGGLRLHHAGELLHENLHGDDGQQAAASVPSAGRSLRPGAKVSRTQSDVRDDAVARGAGTAVPAADVFVQAFEVGNGGGDNPVRKLLVVNKQEHPLALHLGADLGVSESTATRYIAGDAPWLPIRNNTWGLLSSASAGGLPGWFVGVLSL